MTKKDYYLGIALAVAKKSSCLRKQYGAVIVKDDSVVATGYNGPPRGEAHCTACTKIDCNKDMTEYETCPAVHAEMNAIISSARKEMLGADLYLAGYDLAYGAENLNARPCEICLRLIKNSGINRIINSTGVIYERSNDGILRQR